MAGMKKDVDELLRILQSRKYGCTVTATGGKHWRVSRENYGTIIVSRTPSDSHAIRNIRSDVKKHLGIQL
jgi:hypothetical protein